MSDNNDITSSMEKDDSLDSVKSKKLLKDVGLIFSEIKDVTKKNSDIKHGNNINTFLIVGNICFVIILIIFFALSIPSKKYIYSALGDQIPEEIRIVKSTIDSLKEITKSLESNKDNKKSLDFKNLFEMVEKIEKRKIVSLEEFNTFSSTVNNFIKVQTENKKEVNNPKIDDNLIKAMTEKITAINTQLGSLKISDTANLGGELSKLQKSILNMEKNINEGRVFDKTFKDIRGDLDKNFNEIKKEISNSKVNMEKLNDLQKSVNQLGVDVSRIKNIQPEKKKIMIVFAVNSNFNPIKIPLETDIVLPVLKVLDLNNINASVSLEFVGQNVNWFENSKKSVKIPDNFSDINSKIDIQYLNSLEKNVKQLGINEVLFVLPPDSQAPLEIDGNPLFLNGVKVHLIYLTHKNNGIIPSVAFKWRSFSALNGGLFFFHEFSINDYEKNLLNAISLILGKSFK